MFPDRHGVLQRVDAESRRAEGRSAMGTRRDDHDRDVDHDECSHAMLQHESADLAPARA